MGLGRLAVVLGLAGCSGKSATKGIEDARHPQPRTDAPEAHMPTGPYRVDASAKTGDVQVRVEWKNVPSDLRAPVQKAPCADPPSLPALAPTTTWGIPEVLVSIETDHGKAPPTDAAHIQVGACGSAPRVAITGPTLTVASTAEEPVRLTLVESSKLPLGSPGTDQTPRTIYLPFAGHEVIANVAPGTVYRLASSGDGTTIVSASTPYVAITEANGQVIIRDVPIGTYPVRAWLPARANAPSKLASGTVTIADGALAEVTLDISAP